MAALPSWDWQIGIECAQGADCGQGWQGRHALLWVLFASLETIEPGETLQVVLWVAVATSVCVFPGA